MSKMWRSKSRSFSSNNSRENIENADKSDKSSEDPKIGSSGKSSSRYDLWQRCHNEILQQKEASSSKSDQNQSKIRQKFGEALRQEAESQATVAKQFQDIDQDIR